jgi:hypothetical protein
MVTCILMNEMSWDDYGFIRFQWLKHIIPVVSAIPVIIITVLELVCYIHHINLTEMTSLCSGKCQRKTISLLV